MKITTRSQQANHSLTPCANQNEPWLGMEASEAKPSPHAKSNTPTISETSSSHLPPRPSSLPNTPCAAIPKNHDAQQKIVSLKVTFLYYVEMQNIFDKNVQSKHFLKQKKGNQLQMSSRKFPTLFMLLNFNFNCLCHRTIFILISLLSYCLSYMGT